MKTTTATHPAAAPDTGHRHAVVSFENVTKGYGSVRAVDGLSPALHPGETVALLGPDGAGKSSTLDLLLGLRPAAVGAPPRTPTPRTPARLDLPACRGQLRAAARR